MRAGVQMSAPMEQARYTHNPQHAWRQRQKEHWGLLASSLTEKLSEGACFKGIAEKIEKDT